MRFIFNTANSNELSATRRYTVLADDCKAGMIPVPPRWTARATALRNLHGYWNHFPLHVWCLPSISGLRSSQPGNLFSMFLALYAFLRKYKFCLNRPIVRYYNLRAKLY